MYKAPYLQSVSFKYTLALNIAHKHTQTWFFFVSFYTSANFYLYCV